MPGPSLRHADAALAAGRALAWGLLIGGWLLLAALGRQLWPLAAGLWLPAVWLLGTAVALAWAGRRPVTPAAQVLVALGLAGAGGLAVSMSADRSVAGAAGLALAWGGLLALAATVVRGLRLARAEALAPATAQRPGHAAGRPPRPTGAAAAGALLAWLAFGNAAAMDAPTLRDAATWALPPVALALAALAWGAGQAASACRSGLFDCAWPQRLPGLLQRPAQWPGVAAALAMLPMMATLPWMADWCGRPGAAPAEVAAQHLAAMLLPALLASALPGRVRLPRHGVAALLMLGGAALLAWPGREGLAAAAITQGLAWSLAWRLRLDREGAGHGSGAAGTPCGATRHGAARGLATSALALVMLGLALDAFGPQALVALHGALAVAGLLGAVAAWAQHAALAGPRRRHEQGGPQAASHRMRAPSAGTR